MPVSMDWDNADHSIIRVTFQGQWERDDIERMITKGVSMLETVNHEVDSIFDFTQSTFSPRKLLASVDRMENTHNPNERLVIIVNANIYIRSVIKVARVLAPKTFAYIYFVDCLSSAYTLIEQFVQPTFV
ncbi:MAG: hypothetical protein LCI00_34135 [Chloroflexi bacterium]|nr:hypothetical protein [Chloroflexota bacterium]MCC6894456.1 hypothetical protein [Anaerolineae bacterium]